jgi:short-subunit dehydrogenase
MTPKDKLAIATGATKGIGPTGAQESALEGTRVVLAGRTES